MANYSYLQSDHVKDIFPAGFRSSEYATASQTTEQHLTQYKILSANPQNNTFLIINPLNDAEYILGIYGYVFFIDKSHLDKLVEDSTIQYAHLALRKIGNTDTSKLSTIGLVIANGAYLIGDGDNTSSIIHPLDQKLNNSDNSGLTYFKGLILTDSEAKELNNLKIDESDPNSEDYYTIYTYTFNVSEEGDKRVIIPTNLRLDASEIRTISYDEKGNKIATNTSIDEEFTTDKLNVENLTANKINNISVAEVTEDNKNKYIEIKNDNKNISLKLKSDVVLENKLTLKEDVVIEERSAVIGDENSPIIKSKSGEFIANNLEIITSKNKTTLEITPSKVTIPNYIKNIDNQIIDNQVLGKSAWIPYTSSAEINSLVARDANGKSEFTTVKAADVSTDTINSIPIKLNSENFKGIEIGSTDIGCKFELAENLNLEAAIKDEVPYLALISKKEGDSNAVTNISITNQFDTSAPVRITAPTEIYINEKTSKPEINIGGKVLALDGDFRAPAQNTTGQEAVAVQDAEGNTHWLKTTGHEETVAANAILRTDANGAIKLKLSSVTASEVNSGSSDAVKVINLNQSNALLFSGKISDDGSSEYVTPTAFDGIYYDDQAKEINFTDININTEKINNLKINGYTYTNGSNSVAGNLSVTGKVYLTSSSLRSSSINLADGTLTLPSNILGENKSKVLTQRTDANGIVTATWTEQTSAAQADAIVIRDANKAAAFNNIKLENVASGKVLTINPDKTIGAIDATVTAAENTSGNSITFVSKIQQAANGKISFDTKSITTAAKDRLGLVKGVEGSSKMVGRDYNIEVNTDGSMKVNVPWEQLIFDQNVKTQGKITLTNQQSGANARTANMSFALTNLGIEGNPHFSSVTANNFYGVSDIRLKENITDYICEKSILDLPIKKFDYINGGGKDNIGCIAQDLQEICPEIVQEDDLGYLSINESKLVYLLIQEVRKLRDLIKNIEK